MFAIAESRRLLAARFVKPAAGLIFCCMLPLIAHAQAGCGICHSKREATVAMHKAVAERNCFVCHKKGEKLRQKGGIPPEKFAQFMEQRVRDEICLECHGPHEAGQSKKELD